jgi:hypothetical protein
MELYLDVTQPNRAGSANDHGAPQQNPESVRWIAEQDLIHYALSAVPSGEISAATLRQLMRKPRRFSVCDSNDPRPAFKQAGNLARQLANRVASRFKRGDRK